jgi:hypothetical protein
MPTCQETDAAQVKGQRANIKGQNADERATQGDRSWMPSARFCGRRTAPIRFVSFVSSWLNSGSGFGAAA